MKPKKKVLMASRDKSEEDNLLKVTLLVIGLIVLLSLGLPIWVDILIVIFFLWFGGRNG